MLVKVPTGLGTLGCMALPRSLGPSPENRATWREELRQVTGEPWVEAVALGFLFRGDLHADL